MMSVLTSFSCAPDWEKAHGWVRLFLAGSTLTLAACSSVGPKSEIVVSVKDQKLGFYEEGELKKSFVISTSKFGIGDQPGSYRTPLGKHEVIAKIGHGLPAGAVLKSRHWNGEVLQPNAPGRDPIVSRILWLRGMETSNRNAMKRFIYIHGTTEEGNLGRPASFGCIRMGMKDVVDLFNDVGIGAKVEITRNKLPHGHRNEPPKPTPEAEQVIAEVKPPDSKPAAQAPGKPEDKPAAQAKAESSSTEPTKPQAVASVQPESPGQEKAAQPKSAGLKFWPFTKTKPETADKSAPVVTQAAAKLEAKPESPAPEQPKPQVVAAAQPEVLPVEKAPEVKSGGWKFWPFSRSREAEAIDVTDAAMTNAAPPAQAGTSEPAKTEPTTAPIARSKPKKGGSYKLEKITTSNRRDTTTASRHHV